MKIGGFELVDQRFFVGDIDRWDISLDPNISKNVTEALESGKLVYLPYLKFTLDSDLQQLVTKNSIIPSGAKNISYNYKNNSLSGLENDFFDASLVSKMMQRYQFQCTQLLEALCPWYQAEECKGRTSFRPVE